MRSTLVFACLGVLLLGCSAGGGSGGNSSFGSGGSGASGGGGVGAGGPGSGSGQGGFNPAGTGGGTGAGGAMGPAEVFAEGPDTLYKLDPDTKVFTKVADFSGCNSVLDIAVDKDGVMYGTTTLALYKIDKQTGVCTHVADGNYPNSLSLVPKGTVDPNEEALVGYEGNQYVRIDKTTGAVTTIGSLGNGYSSSGDIVSVINGGTYLTVKGNGCGDCIIEVNPTTGGMVQKIGPLGHASVFGLAFWAGAAYGFDDSGELFQVDLTNGSTTPIQPGGLSVPQFWGAGSTTSAPVVPH